MYYISQPNLLQLLAQLKEDYQVFVPVKSGEQRYYKEYTDAAGDIVIGEVRPFEPLKAFFVRAREIVAEDFKSDIPARTSKPLAIVGVKACDLKGFKIQDFVFSDHDYQDPFYINNRQTNLIISADCTLAIKTCFCLALGLKPYPQEDFDLNLSPIETGFLVEVGSEKGQLIINKFYSLFENAGKDLINVKDEQRFRVIKEVENNIKAEDIPQQDEFTGMIERNYEAKLWEEEAKTCVECGACNTICPTCHCFLLYDQKHRKRSSRLRIWDSCMLKDFARVAGGANPRPKLWMRLRNRFEKKFDFFPKVARIYACTGCGRCIWACPAKIDIRRVLKKLTENV
ncbi:MAG: 4Fe-4S dicluster domain-containing protein [Candidatus Omnitrophica bacterium]|nr:4Fe-4S dicluster domain-containing protein [Candidatus Omnitrophota bacterium]